MQTSQSEPFGLLARSELAVGMSEEQVKLLGEAGKVETFKNGEPLVKFDDAAFDLLVLLDGHCEIRTQMDDVLYRLGPGSLIGEMSFLDRKPRSAKVVAVADCVIIRFPETLAEDFEATRPDIAVKLIRNIAMVINQKLRSTTRFAEASFV